MASALQVLGATPVLTVVISGQAVSCLPSVISFRLKRKTTAHMELLPLHMDKHFLGNH